MQDLLALVQEEAAIYTSIKTKRSSLSTIITEQEVWHLAMGPPSHKTQYFLSKAVGGGIKDKPSFIWEGSSTTSAALVQRSDVALQKRSKFFVASSGCGGMLGFPRRWLSTRLALLQGFCITFLNQLDAFHFKCLRSIANIPTTWGAIQIGIPRVSNEAVRAQLDETLPSDELRLHQLKLLAHTLRRPVRRPSGMVTFDKFLQPRTLRWALQGGQKASQME